MEKNERIYYPLSHPQKRIWYIDNINTDSQLHNIGGCLEIEEEIDILLINKAINLTIKDNEGLRLRFLVRKESPVQYVHEYEYEVVEFIDFSQNPYPEKAYKQWAEQIYKNRFILLENKLYYFAIFKLSEHKYGILLNIHHIISDGWSITYIQKQICEIYSKLISKEVLLKANKNSYTEYLKMEEEYLNSKRYLKNMNFWNEKFAVLPDDFLYNTSDSVSGKRQTFNLDHIQSKKINNFVQEKKCSLNTFFITILIIYINKLFNKEDIVIGTPIFNRTGIQKSMVGMFTSTLPFRFQLDKSLSIAELLKKIDSELKHCFLHQKYPYDCLIKDLELGKRGYDSLFKMSVNYYNTKFLPHINGIKTSAEEYYSGAQSYSLQLTVKEWLEDIITLNYDYKVLDYTDEEIKTMHKGILNIIKEILDNENININEITLISNTEFKYRIFDSNLTECKYPQKTVCELFEEKAIEHPNKIALEFNNQRITYSELSEKTNQLANYLLENKIGKNSIVAIIMNHSIELIVSILGVLKTGAGYLPIDPDTPTKRIDFIIEDSGSWLILTNYNISGLALLDRNIVDVNKLDIHKYSSKAPDIDVRLSDIVYIIYTSGSTGKPKGVILEHKGLTNYICWASKKYLKDRMDVMAFYSSISFDLAVTSIFAPLISGNSIIIYDKNDTEFVLHKILKENKTTVLKLTPAHLTLMKGLDYSHSILKSLIVGGEDLKVSLAKEIYNDFNKRVEIINEYGPTEATVGCMIHRYNEKEDAAVSVPIGIPADNMQIYILDYELNPVLEGVFGELYISGVGVAKGYINLDKLTNEKFVKNPFIKNKMMYKTGDMARYLQNGIIEYGGRFDNQVKIRGHRIESGEIEEYLLQHEQISEAVVTLKKDNTDNPLLIAYIVANEVIQEKQLKEWLLKFLPRYMIPNDFVFLESLPLTMNGKVDYKKLPKPVIIQNNNMIPLTSLQKELLEVMEEMLCIKNLSLYDNYYKIGGDSIKAIQISSKMKTIGYDVKVKDILVLETIKEIADTIKETKKERNISQTKCEGYMEKTPIAEWFFRQNFTDWNIYNQYVYLEYNEMFDPGEIKKAFNALAEHHDGFRINYDIHAEKLYYNNTLCNGLLVEHYNLTRDTEKEQQTKIKQLINHNQEHFDITCSFLIYAALIDLEEEKQGLLIKAHHLIVDGVSWRIILNDLMLILNQLKENSKIQLPMKTHSMKEWGEQLLRYAQKDFVEEEIYWERLLQNKFQFPIDYMKSSDPIETSHIMWSELKESVLYDLMEKSNAVYGIDMNELLLIGLAITIKDITEKEDVVIELERHGREEISDDIDVSRTIGWFTSIFPFYLKVEYENIQDNIKAIKEQIRKIPDNGISYGILKYWKNKWPDQKKKYIRFNYLGDFDNIINDRYLNITGIEFGLKSGEKNLLTALIDISVIIVNHKLKISMEYSRNVFKDETVRCFINNYVSVLKIMLAECTRKEYREYTPSDFDVTDITQADLDALFD